MGEETKPTKQTHSWECDAAEKGACPWLLPPVPSPGHPEKRVSSSQELLHGCELLHVLQFPPLSFPSYPLSWHQPCTFFGIP